MQVTVNKARIEKKSKRLEETIRRRIGSSFEEAIDYLAIEVPVDTGAYANSMHLNTRGDRSGHGETSKRKEKGVDANTVLHEMESRLRASLESIDILDGGTFVNNAPHASIVETKVRGIFAELRDIVGSRYGRV
tara:strand:- start:98 stop:499 length:402 start_codon:yes stop_codon:yes gene_type:complete